MTPPLIVLAGTSESGKSTAGQHLQHRGARRIKIRSILAALTTGTPVTHEGVPMRENFDHAEFCAHLNNQVRPGDPRVLVIESFIDAKLAHATKHSWAGPARILFVTATRANRIARIAAAHSLNLDEAAAIVDRKDARKRVHEQWERWQVLADDWIDNDGDRTAYLSRLDRILASLQAAANTEETTT